MEDAFFESKYPQDCWKDEIQQIVSFIQQGDSCQLISVPGAGRSNILGLLAYNKHVRDYHLKDKKENYHFVMISFFEVRNKPQIEAIKLILLNLVASLEDRPLDTTYLKAKQIMTESLAFQDELILLQGVKKVIDLLTFEKSLTVVLLFEQFDTYIPMLTGDFFANLKILRNRVKYKLSIVFSLHKSLEYLLDPLLFSDFAEFVEGKNIYLPLLDEPSLKFRLNYIASLTGKSLDETLYKQLILLTSGHTKLARLTTETVLQMRYESPITNYEKEILAQKAIQKTLEDIWQSLNPAEQTHFLKNLFPEVLDDEHSQYLQQVGLMSKNGISLPLFAAFVDTKKEAVQSTQSSLTYDMSTNIISKNDQILSDKLTATEFRLLTYFLQHPEQILERQHIIENVWKENKSLAGVSEQALDQLIFRLRQKIEDDPNHPTHLMTMKGRGFKFAP